MVDSGYEDKKVELFRSKFLEEMQKQNICEFEDDIDKNIKTTEKDETFSF